MKHKLVKMLALSAVMAAAPLTDASAHGGWGHHGGGGRDLGFFALGAAVVGATVAIATAPFNAIAEASAPAPQPYYPQQAYQQAPQPYYAPPPQAYYAPPPVYYAPAPYYGRGYYRY